MSHFNDGNNHNPNGRRGREKMVPHGTSTMSDEEFWGRVDEHMAEREAILRSRARSAGIVRNGHFVGGAR